MSKYIIKTELNPMGGVIRSTHRTSNCGTGSKRMASHC